MMNVVEARMPPMAATVPQVMPVPSGSDAWPCV